MTSKKVLPHVRVSRVGSVQSNKRENWQLREGDAKNERLPLGILASPTIVRRFRKRLDERAVEIQHLYESLKSSNALIPQVSLSPASPSRQFFLFGQEIMDLPDSSLSRTTPSTKRLERKVSYTNPVTLESLRLIEPPKAPRSTFLSDHKSKSLKKLKELIEKVLRKNLEQATYDARESKWRCAQLSRILETTMKENLNIGPAEYKVIAIVYIGEVRDDGMKQAFQHSWDPDRDYFAVGTYSKENLFASGLVFAMPSETGFDLDNCA